MSYIFFILVRCSLTVEGNFYMIFSLDKIKVYFFLIEVTSVYNIICSICILYVDFCMYYSVLTNKNLVSITIQLIPFTHLPPPTIFFSFVNHSLCSLYLCVCFYLVCFAIFFLNKGRNKCKRNKGDHSKNKQSQKLVL